MKLKSPSRDEVAIQMAPMIDMVFLLLIFFMVASAAVDLNKKKVNIPPSKFGKVPTDVAGRLMISVDADGKIYAGLQEVTIDELKEMLTAELDMNPDLRVFIRADEMVQYKTNRAIMAACAEVGAMDLIYATFL